MVERVSNRNADLFQNIKQTLVVVFFCRARDQTGRICRSPQGRSEANDAPDVEDMPNRDKNAAQVR